MRNRNTRIHGAVLRFAAGLSGVILALAPAGCRQAGAAEERIAMRWGRAQATVQMLAKREADRPRRLAHTSALMPHRIRKDAEASRRNLSEIEEYFERDFRRWRERQSIYPRQFEQIMRGKLEGIERHALIMFL